MPSKPLRNARFRFFVFTCRDPKTDFRLPLVDALRRHHQTYYIWLRRRPVVSGPDADSAAVEMSLADLLRFIWRFKRDDATNVYFNSTNTYFPGMSVALRLVATPGIWCFDMHDDLRYHNTGLKRWREGQIVSALVPPFACRRACRADVAGAVSPAHGILGNASNILPAPANRRNATDQVLIIASFDERFDFDFLSELASLCPRLQFHLHGWTRANDAATTEQIGCSVNRNGNVVYHGGYTMAELPGILARFSISVAPYRMNTTITRYIDPLRYYHCLNAGLEVISTDIPQARYMESCLHVVTDATQCARVLDDVRAGRSAKQPGYTPITWEQRADQLVEILRDPPARRRCRRRPKDARSG